MRKLNYIKSVLSLVACLAIAGCNTVNESQTQQPASKSGKKTANREKAARDNGNGTITWYLPTDDRSDALVKVTATTPQEVVKGATFKYKLVVENVGDYMLDDVVVSDVLPPEVEMLSSSPKGTLKTVDSGGCVGKLCPLPGAGKYSKVSWKIGCLPPGEARQIIASIKANKEGTFAHCADVYYVAKRCQTFAVIAPNLEIEKTMPSTALVNDPFPVEIKVWNDGTGPLKNVKVVDTLPAGLVTANSNSRTVSFTIDELKPNKPQKHVFQAKAIRTGTFTNTVVASSASGLKADDAAVIKSIKPQLVIRKEGTERLPLGRTAEYRISVGNAGDATVRNAIVTDTIPAGSAFVSASNGGRFEDGVITWKINELKAGKKLVLTARIRARQIGKMVNQASAKAPGCPAVTASAATDVEGVSALLLEVVDSKDPVLIGDTTVYTVSIRNTGSAPGRNIRIKAYFEKELEFVSSTGPSKVAKVGPVTEFYPVDIGIGKSGVWKITARGLAAADVRFKVVVDADGFERPVQETEATTIY